MREKLIRVAIAGTVAGTVGGGVALADRTIFQPSSVDRGTPSHSPLATPEPSDAAGSPNPDKLGSFDAAVVGKDTYSKDNSHWGPIKDSNGLIIGNVMAPNPDGTNSLVSTPRMVAQAYWDAKVEGKHQAIGLVIAPDLTVPVRGISEYPVLPGQTDQAALQMAFDGQVKLEHQTQPNVCTLEITNSIQAVTGNEQTVAQDMWEAEKLTREQAAQRFGVKGDGWSDNPANWEPVDNGYGMMLTVRPHGLNSLVRMDHAVGQAYVDGSFAQDATNGHQVIAETLGVGVEAPVRKVTVYAGVPQGMEEAAANNAFAKAVNLEINGLGDPSKAQEGVYVVLVSRSDCPAEAKQTKTTSRVNSSTEANPSATPATTNGHPSWENNIYASVSHKRLSQLPDGGLKIASGNAISVRLNAGEKMTYWNGHKAITVVGPRLVTGVYEASIYQK